MIPWVVKRCGLPAERAGIATEECRWRDPIGDMTTCSVSLETGIFYRLWQGDRICVDVLPEHTLEVRAAEGVPQYVVDHFVADQAIPRALSHEGRLVLHAGGVRVESEALLFLGESGRGKSTLVASFNRNESELLGDDAIVISQTGAGHLARAVYPSLRLLGDSIEAILASGTVTHAVTDNAMKRRIDIPMSLTTPAEPLPIVALFLLAAPSGESDVGIRRLSASDTCMAVIENSFLIDPSDVHRARQQLLLASALARDIPAFEISYPRDYSRLSEVRGRILKHISELSSIGR